MINQIEVTAIIESFITPIIQKAVNQAVKKAIQQNQVLSHKPKNEILDINGAVEITGNSKNTIYQLTSKKLIPHFKRGRKLYFKRSELLKWIEAGKQKTVDEMLSDTDDYLLNRKMKKQ